MEHMDHVRLLRDAGIERGQAWADLGSGTGAFTLALADLLNGAGTIYSVDRHAEALRQQRDAMSHQFTSITAHYLVADFTKSLELQSLDGILMANSLHFVRDQVGTITHLKAYLRPGGRFLVVEYDTDRENQWVPYPFSYKTWEGLAEKSGFAHTQQLYVRPGRFLGAIYSAVSW